MRDRDPQAPLPSEPAAKKPIGNAVLPGLPVLGAALLASACTVTLPDGQVVPLTQLLGTPPTMRASATPSASATPAGGYYPIPPGANGFRPAHVTSPSPIESSTPLPPIINRVAPTPVASATPTASPTATVAPSPSPTARFPMLNGMLPAKADVAAEPESSETRST